MGKSSLRTNLILFILPFLFSISFLCNSSEGADGRVVTVDGLNMMTLLYPLYVPDASSGYLFGAIDSDWQGQLRSQIGPVQPFYWGGNYVLQTAAAVESLHNILKPISDNNKTTNAPLVLITHSWGTVISYIVLNQHPDIKVDKLITMGSPLKVSPYSVPFGLPINNAVSIALSEGTRERFAHASTSSLQKLFTVEKMSYRGCP